MAEKQFIISIGREFGSGGYDVAKALSEHYHIPMYDYNILKDIARNNNSDLTELKKYDEVSRIPFLSRTVRGYSNSPEENIAQLQFDYLKERAESGESFVALGRCSETVLKEYPGLISIFILANADWKIRRIAKREELSLIEAEKYMKTMNKRRKQYHNYYTDTQWGDSRNYDLCIDSSKLGIDKTIQIIRDYVDQRISE